MAADRLVATGSPGWHDAPHPPPGHADRGPSAASFLAWAEVPGTREAPLSANIRRSSCHDHWLFAGRAEMYRQAGALRHVPAGKWPLASGRKTRILEAAVAPACRAPPRGVRLAFGQADRTALPAGNGHVTES